MLIPIGTDLHHKRYPTVTYVLIGLNFLVFAAMWSMKQAGGVDSQDQFIRESTNWLNHAQLWGLNFHFYSLVTYQFIHASWWHLIGNMLFLMPFGKAVEDRMGHIGFASFYLGCGAIGGGLHALFSTNPVIGASGSVCAVTAAFIVLAPRSKIKVLLIFFIIGIYYIPSLLFVAFFFLFDTFNLLGSLAGVNGQPTAWLAHLGGYASGLGITFGLVAIGILTSSEFDLFSMIRQANRRRAYRSVVTQSSSTIQQTKGEYSPASLLVATITQTAAAGNILPAAKQYLHAVQDDPTLRLDRRTMLMLGNAMLQDGNIEDGVRLYELFLKQHKDAVESADVALLLVAKYTRNLHNAKRATALLDEFSSSFSEKHHSLAATLSDELKL